MDRPCPGKNVTFTCTVSSLAHRWEVPFLGITQSLLPADEGQVFPNSPFQFNVTEVMQGTSITSTATVNVTIDLNGTLVVCGDGVGFEPEQRNTINLIREHI